MRTRAGLQVLSPKECLRLIAGHPVHVGRLGFNDVDGRPVVVPVNYRLDRDTVVIRTEPGSVIARSALGYPVAFEVDEVDPAWEEGWSVLLQGIAEEVTDAYELARLRRLPLRPWAPGDRPVLFRVTPDVITGRRIC